MTQMCWFLHSGDDFDRKRVAGACGLPLSRRRRNDSEKNGKLKLLFHISEQTPDPYARTLWVPKSLPVTGASEKTRLFGVDVHDWPVFNRVPPDVVWPQVGLGGPSFSTPPATQDPSPTPAWAAPSQSISKRAKGLGGRREGRAVAWGKGLRVTMGGWGGDPSKSSWGQTHIWGLSIQASFFPFCPLLWSPLYIPFSQSRSALFFSPRNWEKESIHHPAPVQNFSLQKKIGSTEERFRWWIWFSWFL